MKRIALFLLTNVAVMVVLGIVTRLFGLDRAAGMSTGSLLAYAAVIGFTGSIISLLMSKSMAKMSTGAQIINDSPDPTHQWIVGSVRKFADKAGIGMPEVAIFEGQANAFATGAFKNSALVAVSTGLLQSMTRDEVEAVIGHEVAHIANGDMVTMTLIQGVMNTFVVFFSRIVGSMVDRAIFRHEGEGRGMGYMITTVVLDLLFGVLAAMIVAWFSRQREFRADRGAADLMGGNTRPMMNALARLGGLEPGELPKTIQAMGITGRFGALGALFASHPPIEQRIEALQRSSAGQ
jgi:heat shock protein HtpX